MSDDATTMRDWIRLASERMNQRILDEALMSMTSDRPSTRRNIVPGCLVRPKRNMNVAIWRDYSTRTCPDGVVRATMKSALRERLTDPALVISRPVAGPGGPRGTGVVGLFVPAARLFCFTWDCSLFLLAPAGG